MANINFMSVFTTVFILSSSSVAGSINSLQPMKVCKEHIIDTSDCNENNSAVPWLCKCDDRCHEYGDCCPSKMVPKNHVNVTGTVVSSAIKPKWECHDLHSVYVSETSGELIEETIQIYMIASCPDTWKDPHTAKLCERNNISHKRYTFAIDMPTVSKTTNITYVNRYCAFCNDDSNNLDKWDLIVICPNEDPNCSTGRMKYIPRNWEFTRQADNSSNARLTLRTHTELQEYENKYNARTCRKKTDVHCQNLTVKREKRRSTDLKTIVPKDECGRCATYNTCHHATKTCQINSCGFYIGKIFDGLCFALPKSKLANIQVVNPDQSDYSEENATSYKPPLQIRCAMNLIAVSYHQITILEKKTIHMKDSDLTFENVDYEIINSSLVLLCINSKLASTSKLDWTFTETQSMLAKICFSVSQICLLLHIFISIFSHELANLPGKNISCLAISLLAAQLCFGLGQEHQNDNMASCIALSLMTHFGFLAFFFWANVLAFDTFLSFAGNPTGNSNITGTKKEFSKYCFYAWTLPLFIVALAFVIDISDIVPVIANSYTQGTCFINNPTAFQIFFLAPFIILLLENVIFLSIVKRIIYNARQKNGKLNENEQSAASIDRFSNYAKVTLLMVLTWAFGTVAAMFKIGVLFYPFIILNSLQGVFIFIAFIPKRDGFIFFLTKFRTRAKDFDDKQLDRVENLTLV